MYAFLDTEIKVEEAQINDTRGIFFIPQMYSKPTDTHLYLHPYHAIFHMLQIIFLLP